MPISVHTTPHATAPSAMVGTARSTITHQHTGSGGGLKDIIDAFNAEGAALLIVSSADIVSDTFGLRPRHKIQVIWVILCRTEVRFTSDKDDRNDGSANGPHLFYPLYIAEKRQ